MSCNETKGKIFGENIEVMEISMHRWILGGADFSKKYKI
jgi:hypothetical protein